jgi:hypothetical protein
MRAFHRERNLIKREEIAGRQLHALQGYRRPREWKLRLSDVKKFSSKCAEKAKAKPGSL